MKLNKKQFTKWIAALDSGEYKQTRGVLHDKKGYCCLGVACDLLIKKTKLKKDDGGYVDGNLPDDQDHAPQWLKDVNEDFDNKTNTSLADLNDENRFKFGEIATMLELVYIHKAF